MRALLAVALIACVAEGAVELDVSTFTRDGFGFACEHVYSPTQLHTDCFNDAGERGMCAFRGICRRRCTGATSGCPVGFVPVQSVGIDTVTGLSNCYCEPDECNDIVGNGAICIPPVLELD
jgi:hypothetical protein